MEVTLYTRTNCSLCEKAKTVLRDAGIAPTEIDVDADPELKRKYTHDVPVIAIDGVETFRHQVTPEALHVVMAGWRVADSHHLEKAFLFADFAKALAFVNRIGAIAEKQNHHPDLLLSWGKVRVMTWSHDANAITSRDYRLAAAIEQL